MKRIGLLLMVIVGLVAALVMALPAAGQEDVTEVNMAAARRIFDAEPSCADLTYVKAVEDAESLFMPVWRAHSSVMPMYTDYAPSAMALSVRELCTVSPDGKYEITHMTAQDDLVWVHYTFKGTFTAPISGLPYCTPTDRLETEEGVVLLRFEEGKVAEWWGYRAHSNGCIYIGEHKPTCEVIVK